MGTLVTENSYTNRKVKYTTAASNLVPSILVLVGLVNTLHPFGITMQMDEKTLSEVLIAAGVLFAAGQSIFTWAVGYFVHPAEGDGTKEIGK